MFHEIPQMIVERMRELEAIDARDREDGTPHARRLRQIPPETGRLLALLAAQAPDGTLLEIGTSGGYSTLWMALAAREIGRRLVTIELDPDKAAIARETFRRAEVETEVEPIEGDALAYLEGVDRIGFAFLDAEKTDYQRFYEAVVPKLAPGGMLVADNVISHADDLSPLVERAHADDRVDAAVVPIGKGELLCRRVSKGHHD